MEALGEEEEKEDAGSSSSDSDGGGSSAGGAWPLRNAVWRGAARCVAPGACNALALHVACSLTGEDWCALLCFPVRCYSASIKRVTCTHVNPFRSPPPVSAWRTPRDLPGDAASPSRRQLVCFLPEEIAVAAGDELGFTVSRSATGVRLHSCRLAGSAAAPVRGAEAQEGRSGRAEAGAGREGAENASMEKWHWPMARPMAARTSPELHPSPCCGGRGSSCQDLSLIHTPPRRSLTTGATPPTTRPSPPQSRGGPGRTGPADPQSSTSGAPPATRHPPLASREGIGSCPAREIHPRSSSRVA